MCFDHLRKRLVSVVFKNKLKEDFLIIHYECCGNKHRSEKVIFNYHCPDYGSVVVDGIQFKLYKNLTNSIHDDIFETNPILNTVSVSCISAMKCL